MPNRDQVARYFGCRMVQRDEAGVTPFFVFVARAKEVTEWAGVQRVAEQPAGSGVQRVLRPARITAVHRFLEASPLNTIPTSALLAFQPGVASFQPLGDRLLPCTEGLRLDNGLVHPLEWGVLEFRYDPDLPQHERPCLIVDGQHRIHALATYRDGHVPIVAVALLDASIQEQAFQFIVINNKAMKVPTDAVKAVVAHIPDADDVTLADRLAAVGIRYRDVAPFLRLLNESQSSPFRGILAWDINPAERHSVNLTTVEQSYRYLRTVFPLLESDEDSAVEVFLAIWRGVRSRFSAFWPTDTEAGNDKFMTKVNLTAINEFLVERVKFAWEMGLIELFDPGPLEAFVAERVLGPIPEDFWLAEWAVKAQDNANVRDLIRAGLDQILVNQRTRREWEAELRILKEPTHRDHDGQ